MQLLIIMMQAAGKKVDGVVLIYRLISRQLQMPKASKSVRWEKRSLTRKHTQKKQQQQLQQKTTKQNGGQIRRK